MSTIKERIDNLSTGSLLDYEAIHVLTGISMDTLVKFRSVIELKNNYRGLKLTSTQKHKLELFFELNKRLTKQSIPIDKVLGANAVYNLVKADLEGLDKEHFLIVMLNAKCGLIGVETISIGTLVGSLVHPREVFKPAILCSAFSIILVHNHPSNDLQPSKEDIEITKRLHDAGDIIGIPVVDHIIVGGGYLSMKNEGYL